MTVDDTSVNLYLWDTAGQSDYDRLRPLTYQNAEVFVVCFSITQPESLDNVSYKWIPEIKKNRPSAKIILVGLKNDDRDNQDIIFELKKHNQVPIPVSVGEAVAQQIGAFSYLDVSSKNLTKVKDVFDDAIRAVLVPNNKKGCCSLI